MPQRMPIYFPAQVFPYSPTQPISLVPKRSSSSLSPNLINQYLKCRNYFLSRYLLCYLINFHHLLLFLVQSLQFPFCLFCQLLLALTCRHRLYCQTSRLHRLFLALVLYDFPLQLVFSQVIQSNCNHCVQKRLYVNKFDLKQSIQLVKWVCYQNLFHFIDSLLVIFHQ